MSKLTSKRRNSLSRAQFGIPSERKYPMPDRSHAANAKARASQQLKAGNLTRQQYDHVIRMANEKLD
ncbi:MAG TPA: hypothetical protein VIY48_20685 [Candidatus Paceibacterota bacterium]